MSTIISILNFAQIALLSWKTTCKSMVDGERPLIKYFSNDLKSLLFFVLSLPRAADIGFVVDCLFILYLLLTINICLATEDAYAVFFFMLICAKCEVSLSCSNLSYTVCFAELTPLMIHVLE